jgi:predicted nucleic acid-binding protein
VYLLDTSVISELRKRRPHPAVVAWLRAVPSGNLYIFALTLGELQAGVEGRWCTRRTKGKMA